MTLINYIDGVNRRIYLSVDTMNTEVNPIDIYKELRTLRKTNETLRKFDMFLTASGNEFKGGGKYTPRLTKEITGTRIVPYDSSHTLTITGEIITDDGQSGLACFDKTLLSTETIVDINYIPPQVEIIQVNTGSGVTEQDKDDIAIKTMNNVIPFIFAR